jgi:hypothetical protein
MTVSIWGYIIGASCLDHLASAFRVSSGGTTMRPVEIETAIAVRNARTAPQF